VPVKDCNPLTYTSRIAGITAHALHRAKVNNTFLILPLFSVSINKIPDITQFVMNRDLLGSWFWRLGNAGAWPGICHHLVRSYYIIT
jgi:hypothetical protein